MFLLLIQWIILKQPNQVWKWLTGMTKLYWVGLCSTQCPCFTRQLNISPGGGQMGWSGHFWFMLAQWSSCITGCIGHCTTTSFTLDTIPTITPPLSLNLLHVSNHTSKLHCGIASDARIIKAFTSVPFVYLYFFITCHKRNKICSDAYKVKDWLNQPLSFFYDFIIHDLVRTHICSTKLQLSIMYKNVTIKSLSNSAQSC